MLSHDVFTKAMSFEGMHGWFQPKAKTLFTVCINGMKIPFRAIILWDSHPAGRVGKIVEHAVRRQRRFLLNYFQNLNETLCMLADTRITHTPHSAPEVLQTRYIDNMYIVLCNVPANMHPHMRCFVEILHKTVYNIKMKWETSATSVDWCDARMHASPMCDITLKGVPMGRGESPVDSIWSRWPDACSQNCPTVLSSMIPALSLKSCQRAGSRLALTSNLLTIVQGCGYKGYPWRWWWTPLRNSLKRYHLLQDVPLYVAKQWYQQGKHWVGQGGTLC